MVSVSGGVAVGVAVAVLVAVALVVVMLVAEAPMAAEEAWASSYHPNFTSPQRGPAQGLTIPLPPAQGLTVTLTLPQLKGG